MRPSAPTAAMRRLNTRVLLATGLVSLVISVLLVGLWLDLVPDRRALVRENRGTLAELVAASTIGALANGDMRALKETLEFVAERNPALLSAAIRKADGKVLASVGDHNGWEPSEGDRSTDSQLVVPLISSGSTWGHLELRFEPIDHAGLLGVLHDERLRLLAFVAVSCFVSFSFYLRRMLRHLDPSRAVPERVRNALDTLAEGLLLIDPRGLIVLANQSFAELLGVAPDSLTGKPVAGLTWLDRDSQPLADADRPWSVALASGHAIKNVFVSLVDGHGKQRSFLANCSPVLAEGDKTGGVLMSLDDITVLREKEAKLREATEQAEAANRAKSDFLANMSHEIRTPMNAVLGFTEVLRRGMFRGEVDARKHLDTIHSNGKHLVELINDILDLSKIEAGRLEVERIDCQPHRVIHEVIEVLGVRAREKGVTLDFVADGKVPLSISTDPARLRQIVTNLVGNAIKFTERGNVRVHERWRTLPHGALLELDVQDSGIGIPADKLESIFDPFTQAESSTTRRFGGTGLGLSISRKFARALGGDIVARSKPGVGSTFVVTLDPGPLQRITLIEPRQAMQFEAATHEGDNEHWRFPNKRVLVVDDTAENRQLVRLVLEETGLYVAEADNGQVAVQRVLAEPFDLILMDMQMPVMDGFTATRRLRTQGISVPIIAFTAHALKGFEKEINEAGCSGYLTKPIDIDAMLKLLAGQLGGVRVSTAPAGERALPGAAAATRSLAAPAAGETPAVDGPVAQGAPADAAGAARPALEPVRSRLAGNAKLRPVILSFALRLPEQLENMRQSLAAADFEALAGYAHWLKGSAGSVGFDLFTEPARRLEELARSGDLQSTRAALAEVERLAARIEVPGRERAGAPATA